MSAIHHGELEEEERCNLNRQGFLYGALVLMIASLVTRVMGFAYRIMLTRMIGAEGMGLFQIVFPILGLVLTIVTAGLPVAISKLVAEAVVQQDKVRVQRILRVSSWVIVTMAIILTLAMWVFRGLVRNHWLSDPRAFPAYIAMLPLVAIIAIASIYRGYFQGIQDMSPLAWAQIIEQTVRILSIWGLAAYFVRFSLPYAAAAAMMGMALGELAGLIFMMIRQKHRAKLNMVMPNARGQSLESTRQTLRAVGSIALPVTFSRLIGSATYALEPILVSKALLLAGLTTSAATIVYGQYSGMAIPLLIFPTVFTGSLAVNLVPSVSEAIAGSERHRVRIKLAQSFTATALIGFPASVILTVLATPLCALLYKEPSVGPILQWMAPAGFLLYLQGPLTGILQGLDKAGTAMANQLIGNFIRLGCIYWLAANPKLGIDGVAIATTISVAIVTLLHLLFVVRQVGFSILLTGIYKIGVASLIMLTFLQFITRGASRLGGLHLTAAVFGSLSLYFCLLCMFRVLTSKNVRRIPKIGAALATFVQHLPFAI